MSNKGKRLIPTPEWFDLTKYQAGSNAPLLDWALNLMVRQHIFLLLSHEKYLLLSHEKYIDEARELFDNIRENGFLNRIVTEPLFLEEKEFYRAEKYKPGFGIVYSLPLERAIEISDFIQSDTELRQKLAIVEDRDFNRVHEAELCGDWGECRAEKWYREVLPELSYDDLYGDFGNFSPNVCADLNAPDDTIIEAFKDWLNDVRKKTQSEIGEFPEKVSGKLITRWESAKVLPYLDLKIWEKLEGVELPLHKIGDLIHDDVSIDTTEAVRKVARVNADKALKQVRAIWRHAIVEEFRQSSGNKIIK